MPLSFSLILSFLDSIRLYAKISGRYRPLATTVICVLFGSIIQQAGFDLDPTVIAPMKVAVADLIMSRFLQSSLPTLVDLLAPNPVLTTSLRRLPLHYPYRHRRHRKT